MNKWQIIADGASSPQVRFGLEAVSAAIHEYAGCWPKVGREDAAFSGVRLALAGPGDGVPAHGYRIAVRKPEGGRQLAWILGADDTALMHGCSRFWRNTTSTIGSSYLRKRPCST